MTQVDFYILNDRQPRTAALFTCRLTEKAFKKGHKVFINTGSEQQLRQVDDLLWTFRAGSFLPHAVYSDDAVTDHPILLGHNIEPDGEAVCE